MHKTALCKKGTIHQVTSVLGTSKIVLFPGHNHLLTTSSDDPTLYHPAQFLEVASMVVTWWIVALFYNRTARKGESLPAKVSCPSIVKSLVLITHNGYLSSILLNMRVLNKERFIYIHRDSGKVRWGYDIHISHSYVDAGSLTIRG